MSHSKTCILVTDAYQMVSVARNTHKTIFSTSTPAIVPKPDIIEISSEESENEGLEKTERNASVSKKRSLPRTKQVIELSDSENELRSMKKMKLDTALITMRTGTGSPGLGLKPSSTPVTNT